MTLKSKPEMCNRVESKEIEVREEKHLYLLKISISIIKDAPQKYFSKIVSIRLDRKGLEVAI